MSYMDRLLLRPIEAAEAIGIGRSKVYELLASGELPSIRIGSSIRVPVEQLRDWIQQKATREHRD
jgi:excisionase family DNA binding protein